MFVHSPSQNVDVVVGIAPNEEEAGTTDGSTFHSLAMYNAALLVLQASPGSEDTAVATLLEAEDAEGTNATPVAGKTITITGGLAGEAQVGVLDISPFDLTDCQVAHFVGVRVVTDDDYCDYEAHFVMFNPRLAGDPLIDSTVDERYE